MQKNKGFTLIELLVVIAIIGILSSVVLSSLSSARNKAAVAAFKTEVKSAQTAMILVCDGSGATAANNATMQAAAPATSRRQIPTITASCTLSGTFTATITPVSGAAGSCGTATVTESTVTFTGTGC